ncbi:sugar ABC transporter permease [Suilimivivens sp.]|uniref:carbohydrate ABC transporter permease n=1 Tax=Suilimivivens sp. TaxID=2981669 RepID=UPI00199F1A91
MKSTLQNRKAWLLFLLPSLILFIFTVIFPIIRSAYFGFFDWDGVTPMQFVGFSNYKKLFSDLYFRNAFWNNLIYLLINLIGQVGIALILSLLLTKVVRGSNFFKTVYFAPTILSGVAVSQAFQKFYATEPLGVFNAILKGLGLETYITPWLGTAQTALVSVAIIECYKNMGLYLVIIYSGLMAIPPDVIESARMDGAKGFKLFWYIKLPYIREVLAVAIIMAVNGLLKAFDIPFITTNGGPGSSSELLTTYMYKTAFSSTRYGYGSAIAVFIALESILAVCILRKIFTKPEEDTL